MYTLKELGTYGTPLPILITHHRPDFEIQYLKKQILPLTVPRDNVRLPNPVT